MRDTGPGTLSYEFRKGEMQDTVTIGYIGMESCPGWSVSLEWQDYMFYAMNAGNTIKDAFDLACIEYPTIADCVAFVGDTDLIIFDQGDDDDDDIGIPPHIFVQYPKQHAIVAGMVNITGTADDLDGTVDHIFLQIDDGDWIEIDAGSVWEYSWDTTTVPDGNHLITVVAVDDTGLSSGCKYVHVNVSNTEVTAAIQCDTEVSVGEEIVFSATVTGGIPPYSFHWDFGDGNTSSLLSPIHGYDSAGEYNVDLTVTDLLNHSCETNVLITVLSVDTTPPTITMKKPRSGLYLFDSFFCSFPVPVIIGPITFQVSITENESTVDEVHFFIDEQQYQTFSEPPYEWMWDEINCGTVQFRCTATDSAQNMNSITQSMIKLF
jgi:PKD repeat protein